MYLIWIYYLLLLLLLIIGIVLAALTLPGLWLMTAAAAAYAALTHGKYLGLHTLIILLILCILGEVLELSLGGVAARKAGGTRKAAMGGLIGAMIGGFFVSFIPPPIISTILGICLGTFVGAAAVEFVTGQPAPHALRVGVSAVKGRFLGILLKVALGAIMALAILWTALPIH